MEKEWEVYFTIGALCLWFLFPMGVFLSVARLDKNTDQIARLEKLRHVSLPIEEPPKVPVRESVGWLEKLHLKGIRH